MSTILRGAMAVLIRIVRNPRRGSGKLTFDWNIHGNRDIFVDFSDTARDNISQDGSPMACEVDAIMLEDTSSGFSSQVIKNRKFDQVDILQGSYQRHQEAIG